MRQRALAALLLVSAAVVASPALALKKVPYTEVKVEILEAFTPDAEFAKMRQALAAAVTAKNADALFALVGPTFVWTVEGGPNSDFDLGRGPLDNFKVVFGFRAVGASSDGGVSDGPFWDALAGFASDDSFYKAADAGNLVCGPLGASIINDQAFDQANTKIDTDDDPALWYFSVAPTVATAKPDEKAPQVAKLGTVALPVVGVHPPDDAARATHVEVLLPTGKTGWVTAKSLRPLVSNRLCYAKTPQGEWKIATFDQNEE
jgi:hypothetical protein